MGGAPLLLAWLALSQEDYSVHPVRRAEQHAAQPQPDWNAIASSLRERADSVQSRIDALRSRMVPVAEDAHLDEAPSRARRTRAATVLEEEASLPQASNPLPTLLHEPAWYAPQEQLGEQQPQQQAPPPQQLQPQSSFYGPQAYARQAR